MKGRYINMSEKTNKKKVEAKLDWAEREVAYAIELETKSSNPDDKVLNDYVASIYQCGLSLYNAFKEQGHTGLSANLTRQVFDRLAQHKVLKPVDLNKESDWNTERDERHQQNKRLFSLFRTVKEDGTYEYNDIDRVVVKYDDMKSTFHNNRADKIVAEKYPITSPYMPADKPIVVRAERIVLDPKAEREAIKYYAIDKGDGIEDICRCYHELPDGDIIEISEAEYESLKEVYKND